MNAPHSRLPNPHPHLPLLYFLLAQYLSTACVLKLAIGEIGALVWNQDRVVITVLAHP